MVSNSPPKPQAPLFKAAFGKALARFCYLRTGRMDSRARCEMGTTRSTIPQSPLVRHRAMIGFRRSATHLCLYRADYTLSERISGFELSAVRCGLSGSSNVAVLSADCPACPQTRTLLPFRFLDCRSESCFPFKGLNRVSSTVTESMAGFRICTFQVALSKTWPPKAGRRLKEFFDGGFPAPQGLQHWLRARAAAQ